MSYRYQKQNWKTYDKTLPDRVQENSLITKKRLDHMEEGIEKNSMDLAIGDLVLGNSTKPDASFEIDDDANEIKLNIVFPKASDINDKTIKDDATWSSRKIRNEIDKIANNTYYTCEITSDTGLLITNTSDVKTLSARVFQTNRDITAECQESGFVWSRKSSNTDYDDFWNGKQYTGKTLTVSSTDINDCTNVVFFCTYESLTEEGALIEATGSITISNMIFESENTSISFNLYTPNGTIFDNESTDTLIVEAQAYQGSKTITEDDAEFKWYLNGIIIPKQTYRTLSYPVSGLPLVSVITCEINYDLSIYKSSVTIENRKNVTVSGTAPNDPSVGDIWYDTTTSTYKKWTEEGWVVIEDPKSEVTGDIILAVESIKVVQETADKLEEVRRNTYTVTEDGQVIYVKDVYNKLVSSSEETTRTIHGVVNDMGEMRDVVSQVSQKADRIDWIIKDSSGSSSEMVLTDKFYSLLTGKVDITADKINLNGYTSINGNFWVDEEGVFGAKVGTIGPWSIGEDAIRLIDENNNTSIYMGVEGLNFTNKLILTPQGGIKTPNFKVDPLTDSVVIDASEIRLGGVGILTQEHSAGIRNLILTSGDFRKSKSLMWDTDEIPWDIVIEPDTNDNNVSGTSTTSSSTVSQTYVTFTKTSDTMTTKQYIRLPLSTELSFGSYVFNLYGFTKKSSGVQSLNIYLLTEDGIVTSLGNISLMKDAYNNTITYEQGNNTKYKYIAFDITEFAIGDTFSIINTSLYRSEVIIKDWYPAPEDDGFIYDDLEGEIVSTTLNIRDEIDLAKGEVSRTVSSEYVTKTDYDTFKETVSTTISQSSDQIRIEFEDKLNKVVDDSGLEVRVATIEKYITFVDGRIELSTSENDIKLTIANKKIGFTDSNDNDLAYITTTMMHIANLEVDETLKIGNFLLYPRSNGKLTLKKI